MKVRYIGGTIHPAVRARHPQIDFDKIAAGGVIETTADLGAWLCSRWPLMFEAVAEPSRQRRADMTPEHNTMATGPTETKAAEPEPGEE